MSFILDVLSFIVAWFVKNEAFKLAKLPIKIAVASLEGLAITLYISAFILFANYLLKIVNLLYDLLDKANNSSVGSGSAYGITLSSIWYMFIGFLSSSGLADALYISINLYLSLLFSYFAVRVSMIVAEAFKETVKMITDTAIAIES